MKNVSGKILGIGVGTTVGYAVNTLDKKGKGPTIPEYLLKGVATAVLYNYASERDQIVIENCALGYISYETMRMTSFGRKQTGELGAVESKQISDEMKKAVMNPDVIRGVGNALMGLSSIVSTFKGSNNGTNTD